MAKLLFQWPRWYWLVALVLQITPWIGIYADLFPDAKYALMFGWVWAFWCCPILDAGDKFPRWTYAPTTRLRSLRLMILAPMLVIAAIGLEMIAVDIYYWLIYNEPFLPFDWGPYKTIVYDLEVLLVVPTGILYYSVGKVLRQTTRTRLICFKCGYDLQGNPTTGVCPECGHPTGAEKTV